MFSDSQIFKFDLKEKERSPFDYKKRVHSQLTYGEKKKLSGFFSEKENDFW